MSSQVENKYHLLEIESNHKDKHHENNAIKFQLDAVASQKAAWGLL